VFFGAEDYRLYRRLITAAARRAGAAIWVLATFFNWVRPMSIVPAPSASRGQALAVQDRVFRHPGGDIAQGAEVIDYGDSLVIDYDPAQEARVVSSR